MPPSRVLGLMQVVKVFGTGVWGSGLGICVFSGLGPLGLRAESSRVDDGCTAVCLMLCGFGFRCGV